MLVLVVVVTSIGTPHAHVLALHAQTCVAMKRHEWRDSSESCRNPGAALRNSLKPQHPVEECTGCCTADCPVARALLYIGRPSTKVRRVS